MRGCIAAALSLALVLACLPPAAAWAQVPPEEQLSQRPSVWVAGDGARGLAEEGGVLAIVAVGDEPFSEEVVVDAPPDVPAIIVEAARRWGVDERTLLRIAWCESRWDPLARGPAGLAGLFQFAPITWSWVSEAVGYAGASPFDLRANAEAAAWLYRTEGPKHWGCK